MKSTASRKKFWYFFAALTLGATIAIAVPTITQPSVSTPTNSTIVATSSYTGYTNNTSANQTVSFAGMGATSITISNSSALVNVTVSLGDVSGTGGSVTKNSDGTSITVSPGATVTACPITVNGQLANQQTIPCNSDVNVTVKTTATDNNANQQSNTDHTYTE